MTTSIDVTLSQSCLNLYLDAFGLTNYSQTLYDRPSACYTPQPNITRQRLLCKKHFAVQCAGPRNSRNLLTRRHIQYAILCRTNGPPGSYRKTILYLAHLPTGMPPTPCTLWRPQTRTTNTLSISFLVSSFSYDYPPLILFKFFFTEWQCIEFLSVNTNWPMGGVISNTLPPCVKEWQHTDALRKDELENTSPSAICTPRPLRLPLGAYFPIHPSSRQCISTFLHS